MKKLIFIMVLSGLFISASFAQGWVGDATGNSMRAVNSALGINPINIGIGVTIPSARLHTNGDLRFQGLQQTNNLTLFNRMLLTDANGNVRWSDVSGLSSGDADWFISGTTAAPTAITDDIFSMGNVSINTQSQIGQLTVAGTANGLALAITQGQSGIAGGMFMNGGGVTNVNSGRIFMDGNFFQIGRQNNNDASAQDAIRIDANGQVGIKLTRPGGVLAVPTANLHVDGTVRFENLPAGVGDVLVVDANGNVFRSNCQCNGDSKGDEIKQGNDYDELKVKLTQMEAEMADLKSYLTELKNLNQENGKVHEEENSLKQNYPNPFTNSTSITYNLTKAGQVNINIFNSRGEHVSNLVSQKQSKGEHTIDWDANGLPTGMYYYTLSVNGTEISKKAILNSN